MGQTTYAFPNGIVGQIGSYATGDVASIENPLAQQLSNWDVNSGTTDGDYVLSATDGRQTVTATFTASSDTAAAIAAGVAAAILADPSFAGVVASADVVNTDQVDILFQEAGLPWTVSYSGPAGPTAPTVTTAAGYTQIAPGIILQSDTLGGFTTAYSDASLGLGVVIRNADLVQPLGGNAAATGFDGPTMLSVVRTGEIYVAVASGISVLKGDKAYFNGTTGFWSNVTTGSHVLVEGAQWQTAGSGVQRVFVRLPSET